jgi:hypothetical protein
MRELAVRAVVCEQTLCIRSAQDHGDAHPAKE